MKLKKIFLFYTLNIIILINVQITAQNSIARNQNMNQINEIQKAINQTNDLLNSSKEEKRQLFKKLELLQSQIIYRRELKEKLNSELQVTNNKIKSFQIQNEENSTQLIKLQKEYSLLLKYKLIHRLTYNPLLTMMSPDNLDENVKRWYLIERIENQRIQILSSMKTWKSKYLHSLNNLNLESFKQDSLLKTVKEEEVKIISDLTSAKTLIQGLQTKELSLSAELLSYKKKKEQLSSWIKESIEGLNKKTDRAVLTNTKNIMKFPMEESAIISRFGKNIESGNKNLIIRNNGIDLQSSNPFVTAAMNAEVVQIRKMPNQLYLLITKNKNLYIVYSNLQSVLLRNGEKVETGMNLGKAFKNDQGLFELHFETWNGKNPQNPLLFLAK
ncbi:MAG: peptidoglycan DD-metalloendopeptidase family protein [Saprospiraceae bacterium]|nr:peptidoglycan DD-metalloendopeptidase family protein [Saprospiraceae bacterium]